jgi:hypothetical protein
MYDIKRVVEELSDPAPLASKLPIDVGSRQEMCVRLLHLSVLLSTMGNQLRDGVIIQDECSCSKAPQNTCLNKEKATDTLYGSYLKKHRVANSAHGVNPNCFDGRFCFPHGEIGEVKYDLNKLFTYIKGLENIVAGSNDLEGMKLVQMLQLAGTDLFQIGKVEGTLRCGSCGVAHTPDDACLPRVELIPILKQEYIIEILKSIINSIQQEKEIDSADGYDPWKRRFLDSLKIPLEFKKLLGYEE